MPIDRKYLWAFFKFGNEKIKRKKENGREQRIYGQPSHSVRPSFMQSLAIIDKQKLSA
jgi:hypothetical protein